MQAGCGPTKNRGLLEVSDVKQNLQLKFFARFALCFKAAVCKKYNQIIMVHPIFLNFFSNTNY